MLARRGVDAHDPQRAEVAFALTPVPVGVLTGLGDGLARYPVGAAARALVALGLLEDLLVPCMRGDATFDPGHIEFRL